MISAICLIGFGEVGVMLADHLRGGAALSAWDIMFADPASAPARAAAASGIASPASAAAALAGADLAISAVTAEQTLAAARAYAGVLKPGAFYLDLNSAAPETKIAAAETVNGAGARYVEAAVMSPIAPKGAAAPMLFGGPHAAAFTPIAHELGFSGASVFSERYGQAAAAKLCRSIIVKGMEALLAEAMLTARRHDVGDAALASLNDLLPGVDWRRHARYMIARSIEHGARRAEEMREAARMVAGAGLAPLMSEAIAARQDWAAQFAQALAQDELAAMLDGMLQHPMKDGAP